MGGAGNSGGGSSALGVPGNNKGPILWKGASGKLVLEAPSGWLSLPSPQPHDRQIRLLPTPMSALGFPPPGGPQIPD